MLSREEAIATLQTMEYELSNQVGSKYCQKKYEAVKMAIKALEQQPCEDAVSRKAVLDMAKSYNTDGYDSYTPLVVDVEDIEDLPSVTPTISAIDKFNDSVNRATVLSLISDVQNADGFKDYSQYEYLFDQVDKMPMATPTRKVGNWIKIAETDEIVCEACNCSAVLKSSFCPNCGADMRGSENGSN